MRSLAIQHRIVELLAVFSREVEISQAASFTDLNRVAQSFLRDILAIALRLPGLANLDQTERANHPAIDLGDNSHRVAIQVTGTARAAKARETLASFLKHNLADDYDSLKVFILTEKSSSYPSDLRIEGPGRFMFDPKRDIIDFRSLLPIIQGLDLIEQEQILATLEFELGDTSVRKFIVPSSEIDEVEEVFVAPTQFTKALGILTSRKVLFLTGPPHVGKTVTGISLLNSLSPAQGKGRLLKIPAGHALDVLPAIKNELVLLDDPFGGIKYNGSELADSLQVLFRAARDNTIVVTSRSSVLEEASASSKLGERSGISQYTVALNQEGSYDDDALLFVLQKHVDRASRLSEHNRTGALPSEAARYIEAHAKYIVFFLRFPHNIAQLVYDWDPSVDNHRDLEFQVDRAKDIVEVAARWFERLDRSAQLRVAIAAVLPETRTAITDQLMKDLGVPHISEAELVRKSGGFLRVSDSLAFSHPSYMEGVIRVLRREHLELAVKILEKAARSQTDLCFRTINPLMAAQVTLGLRSRHGSRRLRGHGNIQLGQRSAHEYFGRFIAAYNALLAHDFPALKIHLPPYADSEARVHLYMAGEEKIGWWTVAPKVESPDSITTSYEGYGIGHGYSSLERELLERGLQPPTTRLFDPVHISGIPEVDALSEIWTHIEDIFRSRGATPGGPIVTLAALMRDLATTDFPIDEISPGKPLTSSWLHQWFDPYLDPNRRGWLEDRPIPRIGIRIGFHNGLVNKFRVWSNCEFVESLCDAGCVIDGPFLVPPDLDWSRAVRESPSDSTTALYSNDQLVRACEVGLRRLFDAVRDSNNHLFPTLHLSRVPKGAVTFHIDAVVDRRVDEFGRRLAVRYGITKGSRTPGESISVHVQLIHGNTSESEQVRIEAFAEAIMDNPHAEYFDRNAVDIRALTRIDDWIEHVQREIWSDLKHLVSEEAFRLFNEV
ncbi:MAG: SMEK domain-containing protein [Fimbriimonas sp.]